MTTIFGSSVPTWMVVAGGALLIGVIYSENPQVGTPLLVAVSLLIVVSLVNQGKVKS